MMKQGFFSHFIQLTERFIKDYKIRIFIKCPCNGNPLSLAAADIFPILSNYFLFPKVRFFNKVSKACFFNNLLKPLFIIYIFGECYIGGQGIMNNKRLLLYISYILPVLLPFLRSS